jgi:tetratricopeptide (TPR) repeat protein
MSGLLKRGIGALALVAWLVATGSGAAQADAFAEARLKYERGQFADAAREFEAMAAGPVVSAGVLYNLGNARFKNGEPGRAMAAWLAAERLAPGDMDLQSNLEFARRRLGTHRPAPWFSALNKLRISDWAGLAVGAAWLWAALLFASRQDARWRERLRAHVVVVGGAAAVLLAAYGTALWRRWHQPDAVIISAGGVPARFGPVEESPVAVPLAEGAEVRVRDEFPGWYRVEDPNRRGGWVPADRLARLP